MRIYSILIVFLLSGLCLSAQVRPNAERRMQLLKELRITEIQRIQLQQLIQEEKLQQLWRSKKLQQILTPDQLKKLRQLRKEKNSSGKDSLNYGKLLP